MPDATEKSVRAKGRSNVTSHDVARAAGVSQSVVSRAFTPGGKIAPATRKKVLTAARTLGYSPNAFARGLVQQRTKIVGILMARVDNHFYPQILDAFTTELRALGRQVMFLNIDDETELEDVLLTALQYRVEAMIITSITLSSHMAQAFTEAGVPAILFNRQSGNAQVYTVACDNLTGGRLAAEALLKAGHSRFAYIGGAPDTSTNQHRKQGFIEGLRHRGAKLETVMEHDYDYDWGLRAAGSFCAQPKPPDGVFCGNDLIALGVLDGVRKVGLEVPRDLSIIGFDDIPAASWAAYRLTTVKQPLAAMVGATLDILVATSEENSGTPQLKLLPVSLVQRDTLRTKETA